jgi:PAS domain S-box-containing protein
MWSGGVGGGGVGEESGSLDGLEATAPRTVAAESILPPVFVPSLGPSSSSAAGASSSSSSGRLGAFAEFEDLFATELYAGDELLFAPVTPHEASGGGSGAGGAGAAAAGAGRGEGGAAARGGGDARASTSARAGGGASAAGSKRARSAEREEDGEEDDEDDDGEDDGEDEEFAVQGHEDDPDFRDRGRPRRRHGTAAERQARNRKRNREHARQSRLRKKFFVEALKASLDALERENAALRTFLRERHGMSSEELRSVVADGGRGKGGGGGAGGAGGGGGGGGRRATRSASRAPSAGGGGGGGGGGSGGVGEGRVEERALEMGDFRLMRALDFGKKNFVVTDPNLPDNPVVFASEGFYAMSGYTPQEVIGRNCRFMQGPETDPEAVRAIREAVVAERDVSVTLVNYRKDGSKFWNNLFVAPLRDLQGRVVNIVGVQAEVSAPPS